MKTRTLPLALLGVFLAAAPAFAAPAPAAPASAAAPAWTDFTCRPAGFRVLLPGKPRYFQKESPMGSKTLTIHNYSAARYPVAYLVSLVECPKEALDLLGPDYLLQDFRAGFLRGAQGKVTGEKTVNLRGLKVRELQVETGSGQKAVSRFGFAGNWLFHLGATGARDRVASPDVSRFLNSFRVPQSAVSRDRELDPDKTVSIRTLPAKPRTDEDGWQAFPLGKSGASVVLPGSPKARKERVKLPSGPVQYHQFTVKSKEDALAAGWVDCGNADLSDPQWVLADHRDALVAAVKGRLVTEKPIQRSGYPGTEFVIEQEEGHSAVVRLYLVQNRVYQLAVVAPTAQSYSPEAERFLGSFRAPKK